MKHDVCVITGSKPLHVGHAQAEHMVQSGAAEWVGKRRIKLHVDPQPQGAAPFPEFHEVASDASHWVGIAKCSPRMSDDKQNFLRVMKRLSA